MMDHGSERRKVGRDGGVFHCYIAGHGHERPRRRRKPFVEGRAGPWEASGVRRCYVAFSVVGKGLIHSISFALAVLRVVFAPNLFFRKRLDSKEIVRLSSKAMRLLYHTSARAYHHVHLGPGHWI